MQRVSLSVLLATTTIALAPVSAFAGGEVPPLVPAYPGVPGQPSVPGEPTMSSAEPYAGCRSGYRFARGERREGECLEARGTSRSPTIMQEAARVVGQPDGSSDSGRGVPGMSAERGGSHAEAGGIDGGEGGSGGSGGSDGGSGGGDGGSGGGDGGSGSDGGSGGGDGGSGGGSGDGGSSGSVSDGGSGGGGSGSGGGKH